MTPFIITLLLGPVIICHYVTSPTTRIFAIVIAVTTFITILSGSTKARTVELVVAGATWVHDRLLHQFGKIRSVANMILSTGIPQS